MSFGYVKNSKLYIATVKFKRNPNHDPNHKRSGGCQVSNWCTDSTGSHHTFCVIGASIEDVRSRIYARHPMIHITRVEEASFL